MKRLIIIGSSLLVFIILGILVIRSFNKKVYAQSVVKKMPIFTFTHVPTSSEFRQENLDPSFNNYLILYFSSECDYCKFDIENILKNENSFRNTQVLLVSSEQKEAIKKSHDLSNHKNISLYHCNADKFYDLFKTNYTPSIFIYDKRKVLIKKFIGETKVQLIDSVLRN